MPNAVWGAESNYGVDVEGVEGGNEGVGRLALLGWHGVV